MNRKLNFGRSRHYVNGSQPLTKIGSRDLCKLKFGKTVKCAGGSASKEEVEKLQKVNKLLTNELINERTTGLRFIPAKDDPNIGFVNPPGSQLARTNFGDGQTNYDSYAERDRIMTAAWLDLNNTLTAMTKVNNGNRLLEAGANTITVVPGKRIVFESGDMVGAFLGQPLIADTVYQFAPNAEIPNIEDVFFMHTNDNTFHRFVSFTFNQETGAITNFDAGFDQRPGGAYIPINDADKQAKAEDLKTSTFITRQNPPYPTTNNGAPWVISNVRYTYTNTQ